MCVGVFVHSVSRTFATRCVLAANPRCFGPWFIYSQLSWEQSENYMHKCHTGHSWKTGSSSAEGSGSLLMQCNVANAALLLLDSSTEALVRFKVAEKPP